MIVGLRLTLVGMSGAGKTYWSRKLAQRGFKRFGCDDRIARKLRPEFSSSDGMERGMGDWMGFPYEEGYRERASKYLKQEIETLKEIIAYLETGSDRNQEDIVVDTTGSVVYTGEDIILKLKQHTTVIYLPAPVEAQNHMFTAYLSKKGPMIWNNLFDKRLDETNEEALARCYRELISFREERYQRYADVTIDYYKRVSKGFEVPEFIREVVKANKEQWINVDHCDRNPVS